MFEEPTEPSLYTLNYGFTPLYIKLLDDHYQYRYNLKQTLIHL